MFNDEPDLPFYASELNHQKEIAQPIYWLAREDGNDPRALGICVR
jgi:hypothetical protein